MEIVETQPVYKPSTNLEEKNPKENLFDYSQRAQCLRAIVLGGNEGLVAITFLLLGVASFKHGHDPEPVFITGVFSVIAGALSIATAEFVSSYTQVDIMNSQAKRCIRMGRNDLVKKAGAPKPTQIALAASLAYVIAGTVPLMAASFAKDHEIKIIVAVSVACLSMLGLGTIGASLGKAPLVRSCVRVLIGGCFEIMILVAKSEALEAYEALGTRNK